MARQIFIWRLDIGYKNLTTFFLIYNFIREKIIVKYFYIIQVYWQNKILYIIYACKLIII